MIIRVRLFAAQRQAAGRGRLEVEVPPGARVADAWDAVAARVPGLDAGRPYVRYARNGSYVGADEPLEEGDEVAFIPPVAGGADEAVDDTGPPAGPVVRWILLTGDPIDDSALGRLRAAVATTADGAIVSFEGRTRETPGTPSPGQEEEAARHRGGHVLALDYEAYEGMVEAVLIRIAEEIEERFGVRRVGILHRTGTVPLGEASVAIAVAAPHRSAAFGACRYAIDELKARAPIWKAERFADGSVWVADPPAPL